MRLFGPLDVIQASIRAIRRVYGNGDQSSSTRLLTCLHTAESRIAAVLDIPGPVDYLSYANLLFFRGSRFAAENLSGAKT